MILPFSRVDSGNLKFSLSSPQYTLSQVKYFHSDRKWYKVKYKDYLYNLSKISDKQTKEHMYNYHALISSSFMLIWYNFSSWIWLIINIWTAGNNCYIDMSYYYMQFINGKEEG